MTAIAWFVLARSTVWAAFAYTADVPLCSKALHCMRLLRAAVASLRASAERLHERADGAIWDGERGQALAEEALLLTLIGIVAIGALAAMGVNIADTLGEVAGALSRLAPESSRARD